MLVPTSGEQALCAKIFDKVVDDDRDVDDYIVESWENRDVFLPLLYDIDVHAQRKQAAEKEVAEKEVAEQEGGEEEGGEEEGDEEEEEPQVVSNDGLQKLKKDMLDLKEGMLKMNESIKEAFRRMMNSIGGQDKRLKEVESFVKSQTTYDSHFDPTSYSGGGGDVGTTASDVGTTPAGDVGTTAGGGGDVVETPTGVLETPTGVLKTPTATGGYDVEDAAEESKESEEDSEKEVAKEDSEKEAAKEDSEMEAAKEDSEEGSEEGSNGEEGKKDEVVGEKRKIKPSNAKKPPYTTLTEEKKKKKRKMKKAKVTIE